MTKGNHSHLSPTLLLYCTLMCKKWLETAAKLDTWFVSGETRFFGDSDLALEWLQE